MRHNQLIAIATSVALHSIAFATFVSTNEEAPHVATASLEGRTHIESPRELTSAPPIEVALELVPARAPATMAERRPRSVAQAFKTPPRVRKTAHGPRVSHLSEHSTAPPIPEAESPPSPAPAEQESPSSSSQASAATSGTVGTPIEVTSAADSFRSSDDPELVTLARPLRPIMPDYEWRVSRGVLHMEFGVSETGQATFVRFLSPTGDVSLARAVEAAALSTEFAPCILNTGAPADCVIRYQLEFDVSRNEKGFIVARVCGHS